MGTPEGPAEPTHAPGVSPEQQSPLQVAPEAVPTAMPTTPTAQPEVQPPSGAVQQSPHPTQAPSTPDVGAPSAAYALSELPAKPRGNPLRVGLIVAIAAVAVAVGAVIFYGYQQAMQPVDAMQAFCADLKAQRYEAAYPRFSAAYETHHEIQAFLATAELHDQIDGKVTDCGLPGVGSDFRFDLGGAQSATFAARITRATRGTFEGTVTLVKDSGVWRVDRLDDALLGTDLGPLQAGQRLCAALVSGDYPTAYGLYSTRERQSLGSAQDFADTYKNAFGGPLKLTGCAPDLKNYQALGPTARLDIHLTVTESTTLRTQTIAVPTPVTLRFTQENGAWKVDQFDLNVPNA